MHARRVVTIILLVTAFGRPALGLVVDASDAARYVGSAVTVEGDVAAARTEPIGLVLELAPLEPKSFRAVLVLALISSLPRSPERIYAGKRVRVTGLVQRFQGRPEMVLESASQIEIVDLAGAPVVTTSTVATPTTTTMRPAAGATTSGAAIPAPPPTPAVVPPTPEPAVATPAPASAVAAPARVAPAPAVTPPPAAIAPPAEPEPPPKPLLTERLAAAACDRARARWQDAAAAAREASATLTRCLDAGTFACRSAAAALAPVLSDLEWAEQQVADRCD
jgi:hypothetical protein